MGYQGFGPTRNDSGQHGANTGPTWEKHRANTEATQANTGSNTEPTRSVSDVPTGGCGVNTKPMPCKENANRSENYSSSNYPLYFVAVVKTKLRGQGHTRNQNKTHAQWDRETEWQARCRDLNFMVVSTWIPHPPQVSEIRHRTILCSR